MSVPVVIISIDQAKYEATQRELTKNGFEAQLFHGVDGSKQTNLRTKKIVTPFARHFCTDKMLGCALSHIELAQQLVRAWPKFAQAVLVLEDDILVKDATPDGIASLASAASQWDILRLYCQGRCSATGRFFSGSTAAYLLSYSGAVKQAQKRVVYHIDMQQCSPDLTLVNGPRLFTTRDERKGILIGDQSLRFWLQQPILRVPLFGCEMNLRCGLTVLAVIIAVAIVLRHHWPRTIIVVACTLVAALTALYENAHGAVLVRRERRISVAALLLISVLGAGALLRGYLHPWKIPLLLVTEMTLFAAAMSLASVQTLHTAESALNNTHGYVVDRGFQSTA